VAVLFLCRVSPQLSRLPRPYSTMSSDVLASLKTSSLTGALGAPHWCGGRFLERLGVTVSLTSGHHPQSNGQVERLNQELGRYLRSYCGDRQGDWCRFLPWAEYAQLTQ